MSLFRHITMYSDKFESFAKTNFQFPNQNFTNIIILSGRIPTKKNGWHELQKMSYNLKF